MSDWEQKQRSVTAVFDRFLVELSDEFGPEWMLLARTGEVAYNSGRYMRRASGESLFLCIADAHKNQDRIQVSGGWPRDVQGHEHRPREWDDCQPSHAITCSLKRGAKAIAADIDRRFLGRYLQAFAVMSINVAEMDRYATRRADVLNRLGAIVEGNHGKAVAPKDKMDEIGFYLDVKDGSDAKSGSIRAGGKTVNLELHGLPVDMAEAILVIVAGQAFTAEGGN
jgi:hypothetical protein